MDFFGNLCPVPSPQAYAYMLAYHLREWQLELVNMVLLHLSAHRE